jgi:tRNA-dihydrouridine synthase B
MIASKGLYYKNKKTFRMIEVSEKEKQVGLQLFGSDPQIMAEVCKLLNNREDICIIDVNMGCPMPKVVRRGDGVALMKKPELASEIIREIKKVTDKPVTAKFRKGFESKGVGAVDFAAKLEEAGIDAVIVHGRTAEQRYAGKADREIIKKVKENVRVPVLGSGDVFTPEDAVRMFESTGCDGIMVARGALGNPWIFRQINQVAAGKKAEYPDIKERTEVYGKHLKKLIERYGEKVGLIKMRRHLRKYNVPSVIPPMDIGGIHDVK